MLKFIHVIKGPTNITLQQLDDRISYLIICVYLQVTHYMIVAFITTLLKTRINYINA